MSIFEETYGFICILIVYFFCSFTKYYFLSFLWASIEYILNIYYVYYRHGGEMHTKQFVYENGQRKWLILECNGKEQNVGHCNTVRHIDYHYSDNAVFIKCYETSDPGMLVSSF